MRKPTARAKCFAFIFLKSQICLFIGYLVPGCVLLLNTAQALAQPAFNSSTAITRTAAINPQLRMVGFDAETLNEKQYIDVPVTQEDVSILLNVRLNNTNAGGLATRIIDPRGNEIYRIDKQARNVDGSFFVSNQSITNKAFSDEGGFSVLLNPTPNLPLEAGRYRIYFDNQNKTPIAHAAAYIKSQPSQEQFSQDTNRRGNRYRINDYQMHNLIDQQSYVLPMNVWIVRQPKQNAAEYTSQYNQYLQQTIKPLMNQLLRPHQLAIGDFQLFNATSAQIRQYSQLNYDTQLGEACQAMLQHVENSTGNRNANYALNVIVIDQFINVSPNRLGYHSFGASPTLGSINDSESNSGCYIVSSQTHTTNNPYIYNQKQADAMFAATLLHEAGHMMGLQHPTEVDGFTTDLLPDTPICHYQTMRNKRCRKRDGAGNVMFYSSSIEFLPGSFSPQQAQVIRRSPYAWPAE